MRRVSVAQRTVVVIAWAFLLRVFWDYLFLPGPAGSGGWFGYVPLTGRAYAPYARGAAATAVTWAVATLVWAAVAMWLFGAATPRRLRSLDRPQKIVLAVAVAAAAALTAAYLTRPTSYVRQLGADSAAAHLGPDLGPFAAWLVGLAFVVIWAVTSARLFRTD